MDVVWSEFSSQYLVKFSAVRHRPATTDLHRICCRKLSEFLGDMELDQISDGLIDDFVAWRKTQKVGNRTVNIELAVLARALRVAVRWELIAKLPFKRIEKLDEGPLRVRFLEPHHRTRLLAEAGPYRDIILFFLCSGLRRGELKELKWSDVDSQNGGIWIRDSKTGKARFVPLGSSGLSILRERAKVRRLSCDHVFWNPATGKPWAALSHIVKKVLRRSGLDDWTLHDLRHAFASHLHEKGAELADLMQVLGHTSPEMTKRYIHPTQVRIGSLLQRADQDLQSWAQIEFKKNA